MLLYESILSKISFLIFLLSTLVAIYIGKHKVPEVTKRHQLDRTLTRGLWGFVPKDVSERMHQRNLWRWRRLLVCGVMMSCLSVLMTANRLAPSSCLKLAFTVMALFSVGLNLFWYFLIPPKDGEEDGRRKNPNKSVKDPSDSAFTVSKGWEEKVLSGEEDHRLPTTIVTGFLGSGKTTLVNHLLGNTLGLKILVVENEVGEEGIDHELLLQQTEKEQIILMNNGCVCCSVRGDLIQTFKQLFASDAFSLLNWIVIETTGLADPAPVIQTLFMDEDCKKHMRLDACVTVVDCKHIHQHLLSAASGKAGAHKGSTVPEAIQQLAFADRILLNKIDLVKERELQVITEEVKAINPTAKIIKTVQSRISPEEVLNIQAFDAKKNEALFETNAAKFSNLNSTPQKGFFHIDTDADGKINTAKKKKGSSIGKLGPKKKEPTDAGVPSGVLDMSVVSTISFTTSSPIDLNKFNMWMGQLLQEKGNDLYRFKGILAMNGYDEKFIVQGVHMLFDGERAGKWEDKKERRSRLVFIGVRLPRDELKRGFHACLVKSDTSSSNS